MDRMRSFVFACAVGAGLLTAVPTANAGGVAVTTIASSGPLTAIHIGNELSCQIAHAGDSAFETYPSGQVPGDCGTFLTFGGTLFAPNFAAHGTTATSNLGSYTPFTPVSQTGVTGSGSMLDPFRIVTTVMAGPLVTVRETDSYILGEESYRTDVDVENGSNVTINAVLYRAADCYLTGSDRGFGEVDAGAGSAACVQDTDGAPGARVEQWAPINGGNRYSEQRFDTIWSQIASRQPFPNACQCNSSLDNGAGLSWSYQLGPGLAARRSHLTAFSPAGTLPLSMDKFADVPTSSPGSQNGYEVVVHNPNDENVSVNTVTDTLPAGFSYVAGSTSEGITVEPAINGQFLTWTGPFMVPGSNDLTFHFLVTTSTVNGTYFNEANANAGALAVAGTGPTAQVVVGPGGCTIYGTGGNDILDGTNGDDTICALGGEDTVRAARGNDTVIGGSGRDKLYGGEGADQLFGRSGNDQLFGDDGADLLVGEDGNDILEGGLGADQLNGSGGDDVLTNAQGADEMNGGAGSDVFNDQFAFGAVTINLTNGSATGGQLGTDVLTSIESAFGGKGHDLITGNARANLLAGLGGRDRIFAHAGNDALLGDDYGGVYQAGFDNDDVLNGGPGNDNFAGGGGQDQCLQNAGTFTVTPLSCEYYR